EIPDREGLGCAQRNEPGKSELPPERKRALQSALVEPQRGIFDAFTRGKPFKYCFSIGPTRNMLGIDERADLNPAKPARGERVGQRYLVGGCDRPRFDLKALARPLLADDDAVRQVHAFLR